MRRETAIRNARQIRDRIAKGGGIIGTPECHNTAVRISRAWLFGSTAKGSASPNDLDILVDMAVCGQHQVAKPRKGQRQAKRDKKARPAGSTVAINALDDAAKYLRSGMKKVSIHDFKVDGHYQDIAATKIMIYPRWDVAE